jgi:hypothetical protein
LESIFSIAAAEKDRAALSIRLARRVQNALNFEAVGERRRVLDIS